MKYVLFLFFLIFSYLNASTIGIAAVFKNEAPYLEEWIEYHKEMGVTHFWLYNHYSSDNYKNLLKKYIDQGLVELVDLDCGFDNFVRVIQASIYRQAIKKARGHVDWLALIDIDEFLVPMKEKNLVDTLDMHFNQISLIVANWRTFGTSRKYLNQEDKIIPNLTMCSLKNYSFNRVGKSIVRLIDADEAKMKNPQICPVKSCCLVANGSGSLFDGDGKVFSRTNFPECTQHYDELIRINHYFTRDENYWRNKKIPRILHRSNQENLAIHLRRYEDLLLTTDEKIIRLLEADHTDFFNSYIKNDF